MVSLSTNTGPLIRILINGFQLKAPMNKEEMQCVANVANFLFFVCALQHISATNCHSFNVPNKLNQKIVADGIEHTALFSPAL